MSGIPEQKGPTGKKKTGGRVSGTPNILSRQALLDLAKLGGDPPHIALLKIGRDMNNPLSIRVQALGYCAPYFIPRMSPPAARIVRPVDIDDLRDAATASDAAAKVIAKANAGEIDLEAAKFLMDAIEKYSHLQEREILEARVNAIEDALRQAANRGSTEVQAFQVIEGGAG
jgi:hypothetical protein